MTDDHSDDQPRGVLPSAAGSAPTADEPVDPQEVLDRVESLDVYAWGASAERTSGVEHLAPPAEEFYDVFDVGESADRIAAGDADGVALAAIQGLNERVAEQARLIERQRASIDEQRDDIETLRERLESLQATVAELRREGGGWD